MPGPVFIIPTETCRRCCQPAHRIKLQLADVPNSKRVANQYRHYNVTANYRLNTGGDIYLIPNDGQGLLKTPQRI